MNKKDIERGSNRERTVEAKSGVIEGKGVGNPKIVLEA
jgi:hypothetical protein